MLYLIKSAGYDEKGNYIDLLKIGYAEDMDHRMPAYKLHNPTCKLLKAIEGTPVDEARVQYHFRRYRFNGYGREWFVYNEEIINFFNSSPDLTTLEDFEGLGKARKRLSNFIKRVVQSYFLSEVFSVDEKNFSELGTIEKKISPIYDSIGKTIRTNGEAMEELSKILGVDIKILEGFKEDYTGNKKVDQALKKFRRLTRFPDRLKLICTINLSDEDRKYFLQRVPIEYSRGYYLLGPEKCKSASYRKHRIEEKLGISSKVDNDDNSADLEESKKLKIYNTFEIGKRYTKSDIKATLRKIYEDLGITITPKASQLIEYFDLKRCVIPIDGKANEGFEIIKRK